MTEIWNPFLRKTISVATDPTIIEIDLHILRSMFFLALTDQRRHELQAMIDSYEQLLAEQTQSRS